MRIPSGASRRDLLRTFAASGAAVLSANMLRAQDARPVLRSGSGRIDVHHHFQAPCIAGGPPANWSPAASLAQMDQRGIATAMLSHPGGSDVIYDGTWKGRAAARQVNEYGARIVSDYPGRFGLLAALPMRDVDGTLREIEYAQDTLKADGFGISSNNTEKWPGDPSLLPIFQELHRRKAVVFIHPVVNTCRHQDAVTAYDFDITRAITSLLYNGVLSRCPDIRFIVNQSGSAVPALAAYFQERIPGDPSTHFGDELKKLYYESARSTGLAPMPGLARFIPASQFLFGTDYPVEPPASEVDPEPGGELFPAALSAVERENAERLFPRLVAESRITVTIDGVSGTRA